MAVKQKALTLQQKYNALKKEHDMLNSRHDLVLKNLESAVQHLDKAHIGLDSMRSDMATTKQTNIALEKEAQALRVSLSDAVNQAKSFQETAKMLQVENGSLRRMECANINEASSKVMQVLYNLSEYEVPALLSEVVNQLKERQAGSDKYLQDQIKERNAELKGHRDVSIALDMALNGDSDFIKIFTAQQQLKNGYTSFDKALTGNQ